MSNNMSHSFSFKKHHPLNLTSTISNASLSGIFYGSNSYWALMKVAIAAARVNLQQLINYFARNQQPIGQQGKKRVQVATCKCWEQNTLTWKRLHRHRNLKRLLLPQHLRANSIWGTLCSQLRKKNWKRRFLNIRQITTKSLTRMSRFQLNKTSACHQNTWSRSRSAMGRLIWIQTMEMKLKASPMS